MHAIICLNFSLIHTRKHWWFYRIVCGDHSHIQPLSVFCHFCAPEVLLKQMCSSILVFAYILLS